MAKFSVNFKLITTILFPSSLLLFTSGLMDGFASRVAAETPFAPVNPDHHSDAISNDSLANSLTDPLTDPFSNFFSNPLAQVTSVSQLSDVQPTDWAFQSLQTLVERYGCIAGYPDRTYRGNRAVTRYEFAAGLNACIDAINQRIAVAGAELATRQDLATLQRLQTEFASELETLRGRVDGLETKTATLQKQQFSATTKLQGEVIFSVTGAIGDERADGSGRNVEDNWIMDNRVRLSLNTSFTGKDLLKVRLDALNTTAFGSNVTGTNMTRLAFDSSTENQLQIGRLFYRFPLSPKLRVTIDAAESRYDTAVETFNPFLASPYKGAISNFGRFNPIYIQGRRGAGVTVSYDISRSLNFSIGYMARNPAEPTTNNGLFNGSFAALAQLTVRPSDNLSFGATYVRAYYPPGKAFVTGGTGSRLANSPFGTIATSANHFGLESSWRVNPKFTLSGWVGWTRAEAEGDGFGLGRVPVRQGDSASIFNWAITFAFPDLGKKGSLAGLIIGQQPNVTDIDRRAAEDTSSWHLEALYRYPVNQHLSLNPGLLVILNPENNSNNDTIVVGTVRAIFEF
ncbi:iron uptake porin [Alkalinema pantanalense CENA528]|uniref:iron uptake porin n=1 Tax=Alkalinema pantanalense TaxID=1620705 RepID=UPI003D6FC291